MSQTDRTDGAEPVEVSSRKRKRSWLPGKLRAAAGRLRARFGAPAPIEEPSADPEAIPEELLDLLRNLGIAMCQAGDAADRIATILTDIAVAYGAHGVRFFVLPTGVFVSINVGSTSKVDFAPGGSQSLRLDQVDDLYRIVDEIRHMGMSVTQAQKRLGTMLAAPPRFGPVWSALGTGVLTVGLGLMMNPVLIALPIYLVIGLLVGFFRWWASRDSVLEPIQPVVVAFVVTWLCMRFAVPLIGSSPLDLVIPALVTFLPGAALTMATVELSGGSMIAGSSRLVYGLERLLLLSFGIAMGVTAAGLPTNPHPVGQGLGPWAPWLGVLVFAVGQYFALSAPRRSLPWLLLTLYAAYTTQAAAGLLLGSLGGSFFAGMVVLPIAYAIQTRRSGPPAMVSFLPAFWLLVPGALGLEGVAKLLASDSSSGLGDFFNALLSVVAIAIGVLVGAGWAERIGRNTAGWRGV